MNNPFDYTPAAECDEAFGRLVVWLDTLKKSGDSREVGFCRALEEGVMLGVLIAVDGGGEQKTLYAFSGQVGEAGFHHLGFVEPVFDYLQPDGYFKRKEGDISRQNIEIAEFENGRLAKVREVYAIAKKRGDEEVAEYREKCRRSKLARDAKRAAGNVDEVEMAAMIRQSQFEKAELHRIKKRAAASLEPFADDLKQAEDHLDKLKRKRCADSESLQNWLFSNFRLLNARGECRNLTEIFAETTIGVPPSGAGECCAPKLLQAAYLRGWKPVSIAEYWYGKPKDGTIRKHGSHYPACRGRCLPVLLWMLQGLSVVPSLESVEYSQFIEEPEIIFENEWFCVVNKPSGMLSVPGKGGVLSVQRWLEDKCGRERVVKVAHRLDQDTSGLMIATFGNESYKTMQTLFATRQVKKRYIADLEGDYRMKGISQRGRIDLPLSPDWLDRPRQRVDMDGGKEAVTDYEFIGVGKERSRVEFRPLTGRTHQLRMHAASELGLGMPIVGDRLYGNRSGMERLHLHAQKIEFTFPLDGGHFSFESRVLF